MTPSYQLILKTLQDLVIAFNGLSKTIMGAVPAYWAAMQPVALTSTASIALDLSKGFNFALTLSTNATLASPTNAKPGQRGWIKITQAAPGSFTLAYGFNWYFAGGTAPVLSAASGAIDILEYRVIAANVVVANLIKGIAP